MEANIHRKSDCHGVSLSVYFGSRNDYKKAIIFALYFICCHAGWTQSIYMHIYYIYTHMVNCGKEEERGVGKGASKNILKALNLCQPHWPLLTFMRFTSYIRFHIDFGLNNKLTFYSFFLLFSSFLFVCSLKPVRYIQQKVSAVKNTFNFWVIKRLLGFNHRRVCSAFFKNWNGKLHK